MKNRLNVTWGAVFINCAFIWGRRAQKRRFSVNKNCHRRRVELSPVKANFGTKSATPFFLPWFQGKKTWSLSRLRFMHRRCASWHAVPLHTPSGVLHKKALPDEALFRCRYTIWSISTLFRYEALRFRSVWWENEKMRVFPAGNLLIRIPPKKISAVKGRPPFSPFFLLCICILCYTALY